MNKTIFLLKKCVVVTGRHGKTQIQRDPISLLYLVLMANTKKTDVSGNVGKRST